MSNIYTAVICQMLRVEHKGNKLPVVLTCCLDFLLSTCYFNVFLVWTGLKLSLLWYSVQLGVTRKKKAI